MTDQINDDDYLSEMSKKLDESMNKIKDAQHQLELDKVMREMYKKGMQYGHNNVFPAAMGHPSMQGQEYSVPSTYESVIEKVIEEQKEHDDPDAIYDHTGKEIPTRTQIDRYVEAVRLHSVITVGNPSVDFTCVIGKNSEVYKLILELMDVDAEFRDIILESRKRHNLDGVVNIGVYKKISFVVDQRKPALTLLESASLDNQRLNDGIVRSIYDDFRKGNVK